MATTGSDANNGLASGTPFLTIQHAINVVQSLDLNGFTVTIQLADGTYTAGAIVSGAFTGSGTVIINGDSSTPSNVIISAATCFNVNNGGIITIQNCKLVSTANALQAATGGIIYTGVGIVFGAATTAHIYADDGGRIIVNGNYTINGGAAAHLSCTFLSEISLSSGITVTVSGTPAFSAAFAVAQNATIAAQGISFSGSATGTRYSAFLNGVIFTNGGGSSYFPGSLAGTTTTGGQYA